jgi:hypothetical protein
VAVDGINPSLAFAALFFAMSGNPQNASEQAAINAQIAERPACAAVADAGHPAQLPQHADPIVRQYMPAANAGSAPERCEPKR